MKALILSAGKGERLRPLTNLLAKPAIPFHNKPAIVHILENLKKEGIKDFAINLHHLPDTIKDAVKSVKGINITFSYEEELLGSAGAIKKLEYFLSDEKNFLIVNGDTIQHIPLKFLLDFHIKEKAFATLLIRKNQSSEKYSIIEINERNDVLSIKSPHREKDNYMYCGAMILSNQIFNFIPQNAPSDIFKDVFPILFKKKKKIKAFKYRGLWIEIGAIFKYFKYSLESLADSRNVTGENVKIHSSSKIFKSIIGKDSLIEKNVIIKNSILWDGVTIAHDSVIENCILTHNVYIPPFSKIKNKVVFLEENILKTWEIK